jgi:hypothetical protein
VVSVRLVPHAGLRDKPRSHDRSSGEVPADDVADGSGRDPRILLGIYIPLVILAALGAALFMDNIAHVRNEKRALRDASRNPQTWIIAFLYIGTFGSFIGFSFVFGQVLQDQFAAQPPWCDRATPVSARSRVGQAAMRAHEVARKSDRHTSCRARTAAALSYPLSCQANRTQDFRLTTRRVHLGAV